MKRFVLLLFAASAFSLAAAGDALGCACSVPFVPPTPEQARAELVKDFNEAFAIFTGEVVESDFLKVKFKVDKFWKGNLGDEVVMPTGATLLDDGKYTFSSCDYTFTRGERYLVFAYGDSAEKMQARACTRTKSLTRAGPEVEELDTVGPHEKRNQKPAGDNAGVKRRR